MLWWRNVTLSWCLNFLPLFHQHCTGSGGKWFKSLLQKINIHKTTNIPFNKDFLQDVRGMTDDNLEQCPWWTDCTVPATIFIKTTIAAESDADMVTSSVQALLTMTTQHKLFKVLTLLSIFSLHSVSSLFFRQNPARASRNMDDMDM